MANELIPTTKIAVFKGKEIRKTIHNNEWWFSITDVVAVLTDSADTKQYIKKMRQRDPELNSYWGTNCTPLELTAPDGKTRNELKVASEFWDFIGGKRAGMVFGE